MFDCPYIFFLDFAYSEAIGGAGLKRWIVIGLVLLLSCGGVLYSVKASDRIFFMPEKLAGVKVVIDPGHGGLDGGSSAGEVVEREITLQIALALQKKLEKQGAQVVMTRSTEGDALAEHAPQEKFSTIRERKLADLQLRETIAVKEDPDMFVSVHVNAIPEERWRGSQVFYHAEGHPDGEYLAKAIQASFVENLKNTEREALAIKGVYLLKKVPTPAVLVETGFISNAEERTLLTDPSYQRKVANAIAEGIVTFYTAAEK